MCLWRLSLIGWSGCCIPELYLVLLPLDVDNGHHPPDQCVFVCVCVCTTPTSSTPFMFYTLLFCFVGWICGCSLPLSSPIFHFSVPQTHSYTHMKYTQTQALFLLVSCVSVCVSVRPTPLGCSETTHSLKGNTKNINNNEKQNKTVVTKQNKTTQL